MKTEDSGKEESSFCEGLSLSTLYFHKADMGMDVRTVLENRTFICPEMRSIDTGLGHRDLGNNPKEVLRCGQSHEFLIIA